MYRVDVSIYLFCFVVTNAVFCFNFEDRDPLVKRAPEGQVDSYFGYSVALHKTKPYNTEDTKDNWLLVGAPLGQNLQPGSNRSGGLFKCPITDNDYDCVQVETDGKRDAGGRYRFEDFDYGEADETADSSALKVQGTDEIKTGQWLGVTVKSQRPGGMVMVCAHRYIQSPNLTAYHYGQGLCYVLNTDLQVEDPLQLCKGRPMERLHQQFGYCQVGTSLAFAEDDFVLMGAPGPYTWRGTVFGQVIQGDFLSRDKTVYHSPVSDSEDIKKYSYLGMSVGSGHFMQPNVTIYVAGAPRYNMIGAVYFFEKLNVEEFNKVLQINGEQFGASFGYELLATDVNNDGYDDLLVGAPFYFTDTNGGAVYIYYNIRKCTDECKYDKVIYGKPRSRFGFSMTNLGDINKDGYNDVAIGAPYEDDHGAVYVYLGSKDGISDEPSQIIRANRLTTFGYSLSGGLDMDNNLYPDLLVGSYESEKVLLFKSRPIIDIKIEIESKELKNIVPTTKKCANTTCFKFKCCFTIMGQLSKTEKFNVIYQIEEEKKIVSRVWFDDPDHPNMRPTQKRLSIPVSSYMSRYCRKETVKIREGVSDILTPIKFKVNYTLENDAYHSPILNKTSVKHFEATFQKDCGDDDICHCKLILRTGTNQKKIGANHYQADKVDEDFILEANITNEKESAYEAKLFVVHPKGLSYIALKNDSNNVKCSTNNLTVECDIGNPFPANGSINLQLRFEILKNVKVQELNITAFVNSTSTEVSSETRQNIILTLNKLAKFQISGMRSTNNLFYGGTVVGESAIKYIEDIGVRVVHQYQIENNGQWDLPDVRVNILWPLQVSSGANDNRPGKWLLYLEAEPKFISTGDAQGYCSVVENNGVNELKLEYRQPEIEPENLIDLTTEKTPHSRRRRDINYIVPTETMEISGLRRAVVKMDCLTNPATAKCVSIVCEMKKLSRGNSATVVLKSRLWNSTLVEDYSNVDWVAIRSYAAVDIRDTSFNMTDAVKEFSIETIAYPEVVITDSGLNWWIIGGAVLAGILVLILLIFVLYKCGFFKRKRISNDPTLSGNLQKKEEADHLLTERK